MKQLKRFEDGLSRWAGRQRKQIMEMKLYGLVWILLAIAMAWLLWATFAEDVAAFTK
jgi:hypothetical protein